MFGPFGNKDGSTHEQAIEADIFQAELDPFTEITHADHTDERPGPPTMNGRRPDEIRRNLMTGQRTAVEVEPHPETQRSQEQVADLKSAAQDRGMGFELEPLDSDLDDFGFDW